MTGGVNGTASDDLVVRAFSDDVQVRQEVEAFRTSHPEHRPFIDRIAQYIVERHGSQHDVSLTAKKRKLDGSAAGAGSAVQPTGVSADEPTLYAPAEDFSFSIPRKKLRLEITVSGFRGRTAAGQIECSVRWDAIEHVLCVPVPDRPQRLCNFCILPRRAAPGECEFPDAVVWTVPEPPGGAGIKDHMISELDSFTPQDMRVIQPDPKQFESPIPQPHKGPALHAKAFRGSKEGYLFFLPTGILFGFKKPLLFFPLGNIVSISYTAVLQNTFNLTVASMKPGNDGEEEVEFSMIAHADHPAIDGFVKSHQLNDASMAEARRATKYNVHNPRKGVKTEKEDEPDGSALDQAFKEAEAEENVKPEEDEEDELEEDYDPGSEGQSEGEGNSSSDEGDADEGAENEEL